MGENLAKPGHAVDLMKMVRNSLETIRNMVGDETAQAEDVSGQIQQLAHLEELLLDQEARLNAVNRVLEEFNYSVAHELFAPLRRISGFTREIMQRSTNDLDSEGIGYLNSILESSQQMNELIEGLMQVSRLLHTDLQPAAVDLGQVAKEIVDALKAEHPERQAEFLLNGDLQVIADLNLLRVALRKLLENAWKYTSPRETACLEFGSTEVDAGRVFYLRDNGVGFDMAGYELLFHPFQRLHDRERFPGNGLGLTAVKRIVERHGGQVWAEGTPERGATFYFTIEG